MSPTSEPSCGNFPLGGAGGVGGCRRYRFRNLATSWISIGHDSGWASGGYVADSRISGSLGQYSQQQWLTRNSTIALNTNAVWNQANTVVLGLGYATIIPENGVTAMQVADVDGVKVAGKATNSLLVNSNNVIIDHIWAWRADHGNAGTYNWGHGDRRPWPDRQRQRRDGVRPVRRALPEVRGDLER